LANNRYYLPKIVPNNMSFDLGFNNYSYIRRANSSQLEEKERNNDKY
jgi:hypothetical protein